MPVVIVESEIGTTYLLLLSFYAKDKSEVLGDMDASVVLGRFIEPHSQPDFSMMGPL